MLAATLAAKEAEIEGLLDRAAQLMVEVKDMRRRLQRR